MPSEPQLTEVSDDENQPASKGDLYAMERRFITLLKDTEKRFSTLVNETLDHVKNHFDVVAENIHQDVAGANRDKIDLIEQKQTDHEEQISQLERVR